MKCEDAKPNLVALAHLDLAPPDESAVREHLASCAECRAAEGDYGQIRALLRAVGRRDADREAHLWERAEVLQERIQALFDREGAGPAPALPSPETAASPVPSHPRSRLSLKRAVGISAALVVAALVALPLRQSRGATKRLDRDRLLAGPVRVEVESGRASVVEVAGSRIEASGPAAYVARLWASWESFDQGADPGTRAWASQTGLVLAAWPILEITPVSGLVTVENEGGSLTATPGEVVFAPPNRFPLLRDWR